jgi:hypothetical protein
MCAFLILSKQRLDYSPQNSVGAAVRGIITRLYMARFKVLTAASVNMAVFWDVVPCSQVDTDRRFRSTYCLHHQGETTRRSILANSHLLTRLHKNLESYQIESF